MSISLSTSLYFHYSALERSVIKGCYRATVNYLPPTYYLFSFSETFHMNTWQVKVAHKRLLLQMLFWEQKSFLIPTWKVNYNSYINMIIIQIIMAILLFTKRKMKGYNSSNKLLPFCLLLPLLCGEHGLGSWMYLVGVLSLETASPSGPS